MVTRGTAGDHGCSTICEASSKGRVAAYLTSPWMPPFSPTGIVEGVVPPAVGLYSGLGTVTQKFVALAGRAGLQLAKGALPNSIQLPWLELDRKSTRLNSSHVAISYAVFCLKKKKINNNVDHIVVLEKRLQ